MPVRWAARDGGAAGRCTLATVKRHLVRGVDAFGRAAWSARHALEQMEYGEFIRRYGFHLAPGQGPVKLIIGRGEKEEGE